MYEECGLSCGEIAVIFGLENTITNQNRIARKLHKVSIKLRDFKGKNNPSWAGGKKMGKGGYVLIFSPSHPRANSQGYVPEHRLVVEDIIGRLLETTEVVHHINKNKEDNRAENLLLMPTNSEHAKLECSMRNRDHLGRFIN